MADGFPEFAPGSSEFRVRVSRKERHMAITVTRNLGMLLLAIWLILYGISGLAALGLPAPVMAVLALLAGILILAGR